MEQYTTTRQYLYKEIIGLYTLCKSYREMVEQLTDKCLRDSRSKLDILEDKLCYCRSGCDCENNEELKELDKEFDEERERLSNLEVDFESGNIKPLHELILAERDRIVNDILSQTEFTLPRYKIPNEKYPCLSTRKDTITRFIDFFVSYYTEKGDHCTFCGIEREDPAFGMIYTLVRY